jgi:hypothetical protein
LSYSAMRRHGAGADAPAGVDAPLLLRRVEMLAGLGEPSGLSMGDTSAGCELCAVEACSAVCRGGEARCEGDVRCGGAAARGRTLCGSASPACSRIARLSSRAWRLCEKRRFSSRLSEASAACAPLTAALAPSPPSVPSPPAGGHMGEVSVLTGLESIACMRMAHAHARAYWPTPGGEPRSAPIPPPTPPMPVAPLPAWRSAVDGLIGSPSAAGKLPMAGPWMATRLRERRSE